MINWKLDLVTVKASITLDFLYSFTKPGNSFIKMHFGFHCIDNTWVFIFLCRVQNLYSPQYTVGIWVFWRNAGNNSHRNCPAPLTHGYKSLNQQAPKLHPRHTSRTSLAPWTPPHFLKTKTRSQRRGFSLRPVQTSCILTISPTWRQSPAKIQRCRRAQQLSCLTRRSPVFLSPAWRWCLRKERTRPTRQVFFFSRSYPYTVSCHHMSIWGQKWIPCTLTAWTQTKKVYLFSKGHILPKLSCCKSHGPSCTLTHIHTRSADLPILIASVCCI